MASHVELVYVIGRDIPSADYDFRYTPLDICEAVENLTGKDTVEGCINSKGLLRLQPKTRTARNLILTTGLKLYGTSITVYDKNPFMRREGATQETPSTRLVIGDIPFTLANSEIESALKRVGCELLSSVMDEKVKYRDGRLSKFKTGRRFLFIAVPSKPLEKNLTIGGNVASVYHREQNVKPRPCQKCLQDGHATYACENEVVCLTCRLPGHRKGDPRCPGVEEAADATSHVTAVTNNGDETTEGETETETEESESESAEAKEKSEAHVPAATPLTANPAEPTAEASPAHGKSAAATTPDASTPKGSGQDTAEDKSDGENNATEKKKKKKKKKSKEQDAESRGRDRRVQTTLDFHTRQRSQTPKRPRDKDGDSPGMDDRRARLE